jgi:hypothetical protein
MSSILQPSLRQEIVHGVIPMFHRGPEIFYSPEWIDGIFARYAPELWAQVTIDEWEVSPPPGARRAHTWDEFLQHCFFDITVFENNSTKVTRKRDGMQFNAPVDMFNYAKGMCNIQGGTCYSDCQIKIYSVVDSTISTIDHMGGYNKFFEILINGADKGNRMTNIWSAFPGIATRLPFHTDTLAAIYRAALGVMPVFDTIDTYAAGIWTPTNRKRGLYRLPDLDGESLLNGPRFAYNKDTEQWADMNSGLVPHSRFLIRGVGFMGIPQDHKITNISEFITTAGNPPLTIWNPTWARWMGNCSSVACYGLECQSDPNWVAVYIKPFTGMDTFTFPKYDPNELRLEMIVSTQEHRDRYYALDMSNDMPNTGNAPAPAEPNDSGTDFQPVRLRRWTLLKTLSRKPDPNSVGIPMYRMEQIRFYFRRLGTPFVSPISPHYIQIGSANRNVISIWDTTIQRDR